MTNDLPLPVSTAGCPCGIIPPMATTTRANWIYLFHGEDDLSSREAVQGLVTRMKESPMWEFNVTNFDGDKLSLDELEALVAKEIEALQPLGGG